MQRYFIEAENIHNKEIELPGTVAHHLSRVLRAKPGDEVIVCAEERGTFLTRISHLSALRAQAVIIKTLTEESELGVAVTVAHGIVKREKQEEVVSKISALGASAYWPVEMKRSVVKMKEERLEQRLERLTRISQEAAEQARRTRYLRVSPPRAFSDLLGQSAGFDAALFAYEEAALTNNTLKSVLKSGLKSLLIVIGPEGGFDPKEAEELLAHNFLPVTLGPRILRTELAPVYLLSALAYEVEGRD